MHMSQPRSPDRRSATPALQSESVFPAMNGGSCELWSWQRSGTPPVLIAAVTLSAPLRQGIWRRLTRMPGFSVSNRRASGWIASTGQDTQATISWRWVDMFEAFDGLVSARFIQRPIDIFGESLVQDFVYQGRFA